MTNAYDRFEHAGLIVEIVPDFDPTSPQESDNTGTLYSWSRAFDGDEQISEPDGEILCPTCLGEGSVPTRYWPDAAWTNCIRCGGDGEVSADFAAYFADHYDAALTIPLRFSDYGSHGAQFYECDPDDANCALVFTQAEIEKEWPVPTSRPEDRPESMRDYVGGIEGARSYAKGRIEELDDYFRGNVWGVVVRERDEELDPEDDGGGEVLMSVWGFIGKPDSEWILDEAREMAEDCAEVVEQERAEAFRCACADVVTV